MLGPRVQARGLATDHAASLLAAGISAPGEVTLIDPSPVMPQQPQLGWVSGGVSVI